MSARDGPARHSPPKCPQDSGQAYPARLGRLQRLALAAILAAGLSGLTAIETAKVTGFDRMSIQPRISELRRKGLVTPSGERRRNPSGKTATVWIARECADAEQPTSCQ
jgi:hypothetical protein